MTRAEAETAVRAIVPTAPNSTIKMVLDDMEGRGRIATAETPADMQLAIEASIGRISWAYDGAKSSTGGSYWSEED